MGLASLIRNSVALANRITTDLQVPVVHEAWIGVDETYGTPKYDDPVTRMALVENMQRTLRLDSGQEILQKARITFLAPIAANGAAERREPIDIRDKFTLPTGYTGPVKLVEGLENNFSDSPYLLEVVLG